MTDDRYHFPLKDAYDRSRREVDVPEPTDANEIRAVAWIPTDRDAQRDQPPLTVPSDAPVTSIARDGSIAPDTGSGMMNFLSDSADANSDKVDPTPAITGDPPIPSNNDDVPLVPTSPKAPADAKAKGTGAP